mmetsp:Transcript_159786/g.512747  ORF Transcript_159786/g.512747 Transcript_159786/m.512747 type:complete len:208 (+) Transcript_159786:90-713(+)
MTFWGAALKPGQTFKADLPEGECLHLSQICLQDPKAGKNYVQVQIGGKTINLVCLEKDKVEHQAVDLIFGPDSPSFLVKGSSEVHLAGYMEPHDDDMGEEDEEEQGEEEDEEEEGEEEEEEAVAPPAKKAKTEAKAAAKASAKADTASSDAEYVKSLVVFLQKNGNQKLSELGSKVKRPAGAPKMGSVLKSNQDKFAITGDTVSLKK